MLTGLPGVGDLFVNISCAWGKDAMRKIIIAVSCVGLFILFGHTDGYAFRCGNGFASVGDSRTKVALECGQPTSKEKVGAKKTGRYKTREGEIKEGARPHSGSYKEKTKAVEKWYYNCGENDFIYVLTFEGGVLTTEDTEGYGKGKSQCKGR